MCIVFRRACVLTYIAELNGQRGSMQTSSLAALLDAAASTGGSGLVDVLVSALDAPDIFGFSEFLQLPNVKEVGRLFIRVGVLAMMLIMRD